MEQNGTSKEQLEEMEDALDWKREHVMNAAVRAQET